MDISIPSSRGQKRLRSAQYKLILMSSSWLITYLAPGNSPLSALTKASLALFAIMADFPEPALPMSSNGALDVSLVM